jgi:uncharacterized phage protein (TIGR02216 family)
LAERIAWGQLLRLGVRHLGLRPAEFWGLTPAEFLLMAGLDGADAGAMTRARLTELEARLAASMRVEGDTDGRV